MSSNSEVGNLKNVTNFGTLISFSTGYGAAYSPSNPAILLTALNTKKATAETHLELLKDTEIPLNKQRAIRKALFEPLRPLSTRVISALESSGVAKQTIANAKTIHRKIQGTRAPGSDKTKMLAKEDSNTISVSQQSYDRQADYFQELIKLVQGETLYNPSETDLKIPSLKTYQQELYAMNQIVKEMYTPFSNAKLELDNTLYAPETGLVDLAYTTKKYIKSIFGSKSPQYAKVSEIKFTRAKK